MTATHKKVKRPAHLALGITLVLVFGLLGFYFVQSTAQAQERVEQAASEAAAHAAQASRTNDQKESKQ